MCSRSWRTRILHARHRSEWRPRGDRTRPPYRWRGYGRDAAVVDAAAAVALDDGEAAAPEKFIGLWTSRESVRAQQLALGDLMGQRNRVLRRQMLAVRRQAVASAPSSRWYPVMDDAPYGFLDVCPGNAPWDHGSLRSPWRSGSVAPIEHKPIEEYNSCSPPTIRNRVARVTAYTPSTAVTS